jgi:hypothetical protein
VCSGVVGDDRAHGDFHSAAEESARTEEHYQRGATNWSLAHGTTEYTLDWLEQLITLSIERQDWVEDPTTHIMRLADALQNL